MALLFMDGFEEYGAWSELTTNNSNILPRWHYTSDGSSPSMSTAIYKTAQTTISAKSLGGYSLAFYLAIPPTTSTIIYGVNVRYTSWNSQITGMSNGTANYTTDPSTGFRVEINSTGHFQIYNNNSGASIGTSTATFPVTAWYNLQIKYVFSSTVGSIELKVDDVSVISVSGINTTFGAAAMSYIYFQYFNGTATCHYDDVWVCDGTGSTNNDFLGPVAVYTLYPTGAGSLNQMTASAGSNYQCVDEIGPNTTDYVTATAANQEDQYAMSDLPISPTSVAGVLIKAKSMRSTTNSANIQVSAKSGGSTSYSSTLSVYTGAYLDQYSVFETKPAGGAWDETAVNGLEAGIKSI